MAKYRDRLLVGEHIGGTPGSDIKYKPGAVIESDIDHCRKFNVPGMPPKFERVDDTNEHRSELDPLKGETKEQYMARIMAAAKQVQASLNAEATSDKTLESMSLEDLVKMAAEEEIDLDKEVAKFKGSTKRREDVLRAVKHVMSQLVAAK